MDGRKNRPMKGCGIVLLGGVA